MGAGSPGGRYAFLLLALRKLTRFENIPCVYLLKGPRSSLTTVISAKLPGLLCLCSSQSLLEIFANSHHTKNETCHPRARAKRFWIRVRFHGKRRLNWGMASGDGLLDSRPR